MNNQNSGNTSNQSLTLFTNNGRPIISPEEYIANQRKLAEAMRVVQNLASQNDVGLINYVEDQKQKIAEGQAALAALQSLNGVLGQSPILGANPLSSTLATTTTTPQGEVITSFIDPAAQGGPSPVAGQPMHNFNYTYPSANVSTLPDSSYTQPANASFASAPPTHNVGQLRYVDLADANAGYNTHLSDGSTVYSRSQWSSLGNTPQATSTSTSSNVAWQANTAAHPGYMLNISGGARQAQMYPANVPTRQSHTSGLMADVQASASRLSTNQANQYAARTMPAASTSYQEPAGTVNPAHLRKSSGPPISQNQRVAAIANYSSSSLSGALSTPPINTTTTTSYPSSSSRIPTHPPPNNSNAPDSLQSRQSTSRAIPQPSSNVKSSETRPIANLSQPSRPSPMNVKQRVYTGYNQVTSSTARQGQVSRASNSSGRLGSSSITEFAAQQGRHPHQRTTQTQPTQTRLSQPTSQAIAHAPHAPPPNPQSLQFSSTRTPSGHPDGRGVATAQPSTVAQPEQVSSANATSSSASHPEPNTVPNVFFNTEHVGHQPQQPVWSSFAPSPPNNWTYTSDYHKFPGAAPINTGAPQVGEANITSTPSIEGSSLFQQPTTPPRPGQPSASIAEIKTPPRPTQRQSPPITPRTADRARLARSILRELSFSGPLPTKRPRSEKGDTTEEDLPKRRKVDLPRDAEVIDVDATTGGAKELTDNILSAADPRAALIAVLKESVSKPANTTAPPSASAESAGGADATLSAPDSRAAALKSPVPNLTNAAASPSIAGGTGGGGTMQTAPDPNMMNAAAFTSKMEGAGGANATQTAPDQRAFLLDALKNAASRVANAGGPSGANVAQAVPISRDVLLDVLRNAVSRPANSAVIPLTNAGNTGGVTDSTENLISVGAHDNMAQTATPGTALQSATIVEVVQDSQEDTFVDIAGDSGDVDMFADADEHISTMPSPARPSAIFTIDSSSVFASRPPIQELDFPPIEVLRPEESETSVESITVHTPPTAIPGRTQIVEAPLSAVPEHSLVASYPVTVPIKAMSPVVQPLQDASVLPTPEALAPAPTATEAEKPDFTFAQNDEQPLFLPSPEIPFVAHDFSPRKASAKTARKEPTTFATPSWPSSKPSSTIKNTSNSAAVASNSTLARISGPSRARPYVVVPALSESEKARFRVDKGKVDEVVDETDDEQPAVSEVDELRERNARLVYDNSVWMLQKRKCWWRGCTHVFNCSNNLKLHVVSHVDVEKHALWPNCIYNCQWEDCIRRFKEPQALSQHLQNHVMRMLFCIIGGCNEYFKTKFDLLDHVQTKHSNSKGPHDVKKPAQLVNEMTAKLTPSIPDILPSYDSVRQPIQPTRMSKNKHQKLGAWVLRQAFGPLELDSSRHRARYPLRNGRRVVPEKWTPGADKYEFLQSDSMINREFDELPTPAVSDIVEQGVLLFAEESAPVPGTGINGGRKQKSVGEVGNTVASALPTTAGSVPTSQDVKRQVDEAGYGAIDEDRGQSVRVSGGEADVEEAAAVEVLV